MDANKIGNSNNKVYQTPQKISHQLPKEVVEFAESMEEEFLNMLFEKMESSQLNPESDQSKNFYNSLLRRKRAEIASGHGLTSIGVKDLLLKQFSSKYAIDAYSSQQTKGE